MLRVTALAGGIGAARFLRGLRAAAPSAQITVIGNTADDIVLHGLRISPDLDTVMYTLGGGIHEGQGWGRAGESFTVAAELAEYGAQPDWFTLGDRDIATHIIRTQMLDAGYPLSEVTAALCSRWGFRTGARPVDSPDDEPAERAGVRLIPMTDDRVETHVVVDDGDGPRAIHFQEWWVRLHAKLPAERIVVVGAESATPAPGVLEAIETADIILLPPSNPVVSIGPILGIRGVREALIAASAPVVGVSPIIGGAPVRGMADACLTAIGVDTTAPAVAGLYADFLTGWLVDESDTAAVAEVELRGITCRAIPLLMRDMDAAAEMARQALDLASTS